MSGVLRQGPTVVLLLVLTILTSFSMWLSNVTEAATVDAMPPPVVRPRSAELALRERLPLPDDGWVTFVGVTEDSRCPADVVCVWQGRAVLEFEVNGERVSVTFIGGESISEPAAGYLVTVEELRPYPLASQPTDPDHYRVLITVTEAR